MLRWVEFAPGQIYPSWNYLREREGGVLGSAWNDWFSFRLEIPANNKEKEVVSYSSFLRNWLEVGRLCIILSTVCADGNACEVPISTSALCEQHGKTDRLRVKDKEASLSAVKESDEWREIIAPRHIPEAIRTLPANYRTKPSKGRWSCRLPFSGLRSYFVCVSLCVRVCVCLCVCVCARARALAPTCFRYISV